MHDMFYLCSIWNQTFRNLECLPRSLVQIQYCWEPPCPRGSVLGLRPAGLEYFESCVWRAVPSHLSHHHQVVILAQFSPYDSIWAHMYFLKTPFIHWFIRLFIDSFIHSFIYSFIHLFIYSFIHSFFHPISHSFIQSLIHTSIHLFIHSLIHLFF